MKSLLKAFVLICLIIVSKIAKDQKMTLTLPQATVPSEIFSKNIDKSNLNKAVYAPVSVKYEKSGLELN
jgi:hypothetical protein